MKFKGKAWVINAALLVGLLAASSQSHAWPHRPDNYRPPAKRQRPHVKKLPKKPMAKPVATPMASPGTAK